MLLVSANGNAISSGLSSLHFGPVSRSLTTWPTGTTEISNLAGPVDVDLTKLAATGATHDETLHIRNTFGPIRVTVPSTDPTDYKIEINAHTAFGPVTLPGTPSSGGTFTDQSETIGSTGPKITLDIRDAFGPVTVGPPGAAKLSPVPSPPTPPGQ